MIAISQLCCLITHGGLRGWKRCLRSFYHRHIEYMLGLLIDIRKSGYRILALIWKCSYNNQKQSANSQGLHRLPGHSGESRQLIQWNMIRCLTVDRCSNRHRSAVQSPECSCSKDSSRPHPTPSVVTPSSNCSDAY